MTRTWEGGRGLTERKKRIIREGKEPILLEMRKD